MPAPMNKLKAALLRGDMQLGLWLNLTDPAAAEITALAGFDWGLIDAEHGPYDPLGVQVRLRALAQFDINAVVRVPIGEDWVIKQVLDMGAQSILVPMVDTAEEARRLVRAVRYAPNGVRGMGAAVARATGFGADADYIQTADEQICLVVQAETRTALENIDEIAAVEGVDCVFIGPADLSADMGYPGNPDAPEVQDAIRHIVTRTRAAGKAAGFLHFNTENYAFYRDLGVNMLGTGADVFVLRESLSRLAQQARNAVR